MASINISKTWTALSDDYCFESFNQLGNDIMDNMSLTQSGNFTFINRGTTAPTGDSQNYLWFNESDQKLYEYIGGVWVSRHPIPISSSIRQVWTGSESDLWSYDGGTGTDPGVAGNVSDTTGSFWEVDTDMEARFPLGAGELASGTVVNVNDTGGAENHELDITEMPSHRHPEANGFRFTYNEDATPVGNVGVATTSAYPKVGELNTGYAGGDPDDSNNTVAHNNMPPYYGVHWIKRTNRVYYVSGGTAGAISLGNGVYFGSGAPAFTPVEGYGQYIDHTTRDLYIWNSVTSSWTL